MAGMNRFLSRASRAAPLAPSLAVAFAAALAAAIGCGTAGSPTRPNLLVIVVDTLRADHVGAYGSTRKATPRIDALAARSLVVENAWSQSSWTKPSIASLMSSMPESSHGVRRGFVDRLGARVETLAEQLSAAGYRTGAVSENPHVNSAFGFDQGFEHFEGRKDFRGDAATSGERAIAWLESLDGSEPFFLYLHLVDPHGPYTPGAKLREIFTSGLEPASPAVAKGRLAPLLDGEKAVDLVPGDVRFLEALYDAELIMTDAVVGGMLDYLEMKGLEERTVVLLTSDHGEEFLEHGSLKHGYWLYEETLRIPLILHVPGASPHRSRDTWVQLLDVAPTLLDLLGVDAPESFEGRSFASLLAGEELGPQSLFFETHYQGAARRALRSGRYKLVVDEVAGTSELYDLVNDPGEEIDLADARPEIVLALADEIASRAEGAVPEDTLEGELAPEIRQALEELGYLDGETTDAR
jgi:choline-sulfatase